MANIDDIPLMFRAQVSDRCQLQFTQSGHPQQWVDEWVEYADSDLPELGSEVQTQIYKISWRFVTNSGQDEGIIRPVIGAKGLPFYPGSSMKGAFREACTPEQANFYCGEKLADDSFKPGILRFHGGYPINDDWRKNLVDIIHPQQDWQVKNNAVHSALAQISLYKPEIKFGISTTDPDNTKWDEVWEIWQKALINGIGCRVSAGYGQPGKALKVDSATILYQVKIKGEGAVSTLQDRTPEFRPNIFRAALRGHALRIFGGLNQALAEDVVDELFGGIRKEKEKQGSLRMAFELDGEWKSPDNENAYDVSGNLIWFLFRPLDAESTTKLQLLVERLTQFTLLLGGFGKSWRRADHRLFHKKYYEEKPNEPTNKPLIGCHWQWANEKDNPVHSLDEAAQLIQSVLETAKEWMELRKFEVKPPPISASANQEIPQPKLNKPILKSAKVSAMTATTDWREAWRIDTVQVWGRIATNTNNSLMIPWLHSKPIGNSTTKEQKQPENKINSSALQRGNSPSSQHSRPIIYRSDLTGRVFDQKKSNEPTQIGRLWHRMYPLEDGKYLELITIFHKGCSISQGFIEWLNKPTTQSQMGMFKQLF